MRLTKVVKETFYVPNDPDKGFIIIKHLKIDEVKKITSDVADMFYETDAVTGKTVSRLNPNSYQLTKAMAHASLVSWGNMKDLMGNEMPFLSVNIDAAAEFEISITVDEKEVILDFYGWIDKCRKELTDTVKQQEALAKEN